MQFATALRPPDVRAIAKFIAKVARVVAGVVPYQPGCRPTQGDGQGHRFRGGEPQGVLKFRQHEPMPTKVRMVALSKLAVLLVLIGSAAPSWPDAKAPNIRACLKAGDRRQAPTVNQSIGAPHGCGGKGEHRISMPLWPFRRA
jgi:hypothetical protein